MSATEMIGTSTAHTINSTAMTAIVVGGTTAVATVASIYAYHFYLSSSRAKEPPIKFSWLPILGHAFELGKKPLELLTGAAAQYGEIFGLVVAGNRMFIISDPHSTNLILTKNKDLSSEEFHNHVLTYFFGQSKGKDNHHQYDGDLMRAWFSKYLLSDSALGTLTSRTQKNLQTRVEKLGEGTYNMYELLGGIVFDAAVASLFNETVVDDPTLYSDFVNFDRFLPLAMAGIGVEKVASARRSRQHLLDSVASNRDGLSDLIGKRWEYFDELVRGGKTIGSDATSWQLSMLWASAGNTAPTLFWVLYYILHTPEIQAEVLQEIATVCGRDGSSLSSSTSFTGVDCEISQEQLNRMLLLDACITEALRLTSGSMIMRVVLRPISLTLASGNTYSFRKGDRVGICPPITHNDEEVFPDASAFNPKRWLVGETLEEKMLAVTGKIPLQKDGKPLNANLVFLPFGGGPTFCPGRRFARNEMKTAAAALLTRFEMVVVKDRERGGVTSSLDVSGVGSGGVFREEKGGGPGFDGSRAGIGIFPPNPKNKVSIKITKRKA